MDLFMLLVSFSGGLYLHAERNLALFFHDRMGDGRALKFMGVKDMDMELGRAHICWMKG